MPIFAAQPSYCDVAGAVQSAGAERRRTALNESKGPALVHCLFRRPGVGRRFACYLISFCGFTNTDALTFAKGLALQNAQFIAYVNAYPPPH